MKWIFALLLIAAAVLLSVFRLVPHDVDGVHTPASAKDIGNYAGDRSFEAVRAVTTTPQGILEALDRVALATPRTKRLAGTPEAGLVTYVTRSAVFGFPDYATVEARADGGVRLQIQSRARFGKLDMGVNKARVQDWLAQLGPLIVAP